MRGRDDKPIKHVHEVRVHVDASQDGPPPAWAKQLMAVFGMMEGRLMAKFDEVLAELTAAAEEDTNANTAIIGMLDALLAEVEANVDNEAALRDVLAKFKANTAQISEAVLRGTPAEETPEEPDEPEEPQE